MSNKSQNMNTLYDRLETEVLLGLLENEKNYASGTKAIVTALKLQLA